MLIFCGLLFIGTLYLIYKGEENHKEAEEKIEEYEAVKEYLGK